MATRRWVLMTEDAANDLNPREQIVRRLPFLGVPITKLGVNRELSMTTYRSASVFPNVPHIYLCGLVLLFTRRYLSIDGEGG
jgi:hypothetical protein